MKDEEKSFCNRLHFYKRYEMRVRDKMESSENSRRFSSRASPTLRRLQERRWEDQQDQNKGQIFSLLFFL